MSRKQTHPADAPAALDWQVIVPVKHRSAAKSRLIVPRGVSRSQLAHAMARDTVHAAAVAVGPAAVTVLTSDELMSAWALEHDVTVLADPGGGLNDALAFALSRHRGARVAVLLGDLPALRPEHLEVALAAGGRHRLAFVPDRDGAGTCLLTSTGPDLVPWFGPDSAWRHEHLLGARQLDLPLPELRADVDTATDLTAALALGVGAHTRLALLNR